MKFLLLLLFPVFSYSQMKEPINLFNGKDLSGWEIFGTEKWYVENKNIVCENGPDKDYGYLATTEKFKDFELNLMFKLVSKGLAGVFFHSDIIGNKISGMQSEIAPPGSFSGGIYESYKREWLIKPPIEIDNVKMNSWNSMKVKVVGTEVTTWVNGKQMIYLNDAAIGEVDGKIALQIQGGGGIKVEWKNIKIIKL